MNPAPPPTQTLMVPSLGGSVKDIYIDIGIEIVERGLVRLIQPHKKRLSTCYCFA